MLCNISKTSASERGSKHQETDESMRPQGECFYCFKVFGTPMKHRAQVFDKTSQMKQYRFIQCHIFCIFLLKYCHIHNLLYSPFCITKCEKVRVSV